MRWHRFGPAPRTKRRRLAAPRTSRPLNGLKAAGEPGDASRPAIVWAPAVDLALAGDTTALRLCLERLAPPAKSRRVKLDLPKLESPEDLVAALAEVIAAMGAGQIALDEAAMISGVLEAKRQSIETAGLERRLAVLEKKAGASKYSQPRGLAPATPTQASYARAEAVAKSNSLVEVHASSSPAHRRACRATSRWRAPRPIRGFEGQLGRPSLPKFIAGLAILWWFSQKRRPLVGPGPLTDTLQDRPRSLLRRRLLVPLVRQPQQAEVG
jgi:hypothetical protein